MAFLSTIGHYFKSKLQNDSVCLVNGQGHLSGSVDSSSSSMTNVGPKRDSFVSSVTILGVATTLAMHLAQDSYAYSNNTTTFGMDQEVPRPLIKPVTATTRQHQSVIHFTSIAEEEATTIIFFGMPR